MDTITEKHDGHTADTIAAVATIIAMIANDYEVGSSEPMSVCEVSDIYTQAYRACDTSDSAVILNIDAVALKHLIDFTDGAVIEHKDMVYLKNLEDATTESDLPEKCKVVLKRIRRMGVRTIHDLWMNTSYTYKDIIRALIILYFNGYIFVTISENSDDYTYTSGVWYAPSV